MFYVYYGNDTEAVRQMAFAKLAKLRENDPNLAVHQLSPEDYEVGQIVSASSTVSLFGGAAAYLIDMPSTNSDCLAELSREAAALVASGHHFVVIEGSLLAADKKPLSGATEITEYKKTGGGKFDAFKLADALARRDKRSLWLLLTESRRAGMSAEEVIGILWWQMKTLRLAILTKSASEAGVKDFPYNKAKKSLINFKSGEVENLSRSLLLLYHEGHVGKVDINLALEEWVLKG